MRTPADKIISRDDFPKIRDKLKKEGKKIVLCHGVFDLVHQGHLEHFADAKKQGDVLVVSVTAAKYVNKGPGRPYFGDSERLNFIANLEIVDYVLLSEAVTVHDIVRAVQPDIYAKGKEYAVAKNDLTGNIGSEEAIVREYGGEIYYTEGKVFSSTKLLNNFFSALPENVVDYANKLKKKYGDDVLSQIREKIEAFKKKKVLVVGDVIFDEYSFVNIQGVTMKDGSLSTFFEEKERYAGGSLAIARHLSEFAGKVTLCSMIGTEPGYMDFIRESMEGVKLEIIEDEEFVTPVKHRYVKSNKQRQDYDKLFSVNTLMRRHDIRHHDYSAFYNKLKKLIPKYDVVIIGDFGHGLIDQNARDIIQEKSKFLALNVQTNSANMGMNLITKYDRADSFVVDERELKMAFGQHLAGKDKLLEKLIQKMSTNVGWVTVGAMGAIGMRPSAKQKALCPALTLEVTDTVGAGDAFFALASMCAESDIPVDMATLVANVAAALKTNVIGNKDYVHKVDLLKFLSTVLNV
ncbi:PfkB family carbohydrate kinase [Butyrivibrio sp. INlla16]|uniref:PfkB family carbohydrate kinase n=1 Tax=Butyrivibrio sp. INlla16 TaxID=1520807 RepID=UPI000884914C|nr:PfkB family carbohydrate kinase [Butyrivibrio sp. INlla16]SDB60185.1 rfaE bifunctional protein, domain II [Butyrivibrio sp. INlla16]